MLGHILGGWTIAPLFTALSGGGTSVSYTEGNCTGCEAFGEVTTPGTSSVSCDVGKCRRPFALHRQHIGEVQRVYFTGDQRQQHG